VQARNPSAAIHIGGDSMAFGAVYGPPFVREGEVRRDGTLEDYRNFAKLSQSSSGARLSGRRGLRAERRPPGLAPPRHDAALMTLTDKVFMGNVVSGDNAARHDRDVRDPLRRPRGDRGPPGLHLA
jgi:trimethylamine--corrinoid protein Co-methyltransferase